MSLNEKTPAEAPGINLNVEGIEGRIGKPQFF